MIQTPSHLDIDLNYIYSLQLDLIQILNDEIDLELVYTKTSNLSVNIKVTLSIQYYVKRSDQLLISLRRECSGSDKTDSDSKD